MSPGDLSMEMIARLFIDAFNRRDAEALVALADPAIEWRPSSLAGSQRIYRGHDGLRLWVSELDTAPVKHQARVREVRELDERRFAVLSEVLVDGELPSPSAMLASLTGEGKIVEARAYLSDEQTLAEIGLVPGPTTVR
jgi:hypothetical protein